MRSARGSLAVSVFLLFSLYLLHVTLRSTDNKQSRGAAGPTRPVESDGKAEIVVASKAQGPPSPNHQPALEPHPVTRDQERPAKHAATSALALPSTPSTPSNTQQPPSWPTHAAASIVDAEDVVLLLKTGSSNVWRRLPLHFLTTFANDRIPNYAIYSDAAESLAPGIATIDILANVSHLLDPAARRIYTSQLAAIRPNAYREQVGLAGDAGPPAAPDGNPEGWVLDRYKFLPMLQHAHARWPAAKWYFYVEDDTYPLWHNVRQWLARLPAAAQAEPAHYYGAASGPSNATFAQGGSGIAFPQALMQSLFSGPAPASLDRYANLTAGSCCGDVVLGAILRDRGARVNNGSFGDTLLLRPEPPWRTRFDVSVWCEPALTFHHLHQRDLALLAELEADLRRGGPGEPPREKVLFRDVFAKLVQPYLRDEVRAGWDNYADLWVLRPGRGVVRPQGLSGAEVVDVDRAAGSAEGCRGACQAVEKCFSWRYTRGECALDSGVKFGRAVPGAAAVGEGNATALAGATVTSGWVMERVNRTLLSNECWGFRD